MNDRKLSASEKITNEFLIHISYVVCACFILIYIYNARLFLYGTTIGLLMPVLLWTLCIISAILTIIMYALFLKKRQRGILFISLYLFASTLSLFWTVGLEELAARLKKYSPLFVRLNNTKFNIELLFCVLGFSVIIALLVYFFRMFKLKHGIVPKSLQKNK